MAGSLVKVLGPAVGARRNRGNDLCITPTDYRGAGSIYVYETGVPTCSLCRTKSGSGNRYLCASSARSGRNVIDMRRRNRKVDVAWTAYTTHRYLDVSGHCRGRNSRYDLSI